MLDQSAMGLVDGFVKAYYDAQQLLDDNDVDRASEKYQEMLGIYKQLETQGTEEDRKIAHEQLCKLYYQIQEPPKSVAPYFAAGIFIVLISFVIVVQPSIVGLQIFPDTIYQDINVQTARSGFLNITLQGVPTSLEIQASGAGKIYLVKGKNLVAVWDGGAGFECVDSCVLDGISSNKIVLLVEVGDTPITLKKVKYTARAVPNNAPKFTGSAKTFAAPFSLNLSQQFSDQDGDSLVFLASKQPGLRVSLVSDVLTVEAEESGKRTITLYASDLKDVTKVPITVTA